MKPAKLSVYQDKTFVQTNLGDPCIHKIGQTLQNVLIYVERTLLIGLDDCRAGRGLAHSLHKHEFYFNHFEDVLTHAEHFIICGIR